MTSRAALRAALNKPAEGDEHKRTRLEAWADNLATQTDPEMQLSILKFLEGSSPPPDKSEANAATEDIEALRDFLDRFQPPRNAKGR